MGIDKIRQNHWYFISSARSKIMDNKYFEWDQDFILDIEDIDQQHYALVETINKSLQLSLSNEEIQLHKIKDIHDHLLNYTVDHFKTEEALMKTSRIDFRHLKEHVMVHREFITRVKAFFEDLNKLKNPAALSQVNEFLIRWLAYHILNMDKGMARQIKLIVEGGLSPKDAYEKEVDYVETSTEPLLKALRALFNLVSQKNKELERKNQELEKKVILRTQALEMANQRLERISMEDELTKLPNRRYVMQMLDDQISYFSRYQTPFSILFVDVDKFKTVNDTYGHDYGDQVLIWIGAYLKNNSRKSDKACRLGGDEFTIICPNTRLDEAMVLAKKLNQTCKTIAKTDGLGFWDPSISIGVTMMDDQIKSASDLLKKADEAMYEAKKVGGRVCKI